MADPAAEQFRGLVHAYLHEGGHVPDMQMAWIETQFRADEWWRQRRKNRRTGRILVVGAIAVLVIVLALGVH